MPHPGKYSEWPEEEKARHRERVRQWRQRNPDQVRASELLHNEKRRAKYASDPEYREKILTNKAWKDTMRIQQKRRRDERKEAVFNHYGRVCKCCGETRECFLSIDHVNNDGAEHRRSLSRHGRGAGSSMTYAWLVKNNFPNDFQTLCQNCNSGKARCGGICPHERERAENGTLNSTSNLAAVPEPLTVTSA